MHLNPADVDKLLLVNAGLLAQRRLSRGIRLNATEAISLLATVCLEWIRDGECTLSELMSRGRNILGRQHVMHGVPEQVETVAVEGTFPDGTKLLTIHQPIATEKGEWRWALYGSGINVAEGEVKMKPLEEPSKGKKNAESAAEEARPPPLAGETLFSPELPPILLNAGKVTKKLRITNLDDRPIQVGSHYHLVELNRWMELDRVAAYGFRLNIAAGTSVRFEPGVSKAVECVEIDGKRIIAGGNGIAQSVDNGRVTEENKNRVEQVIVARRFAHKRSTVPPELSVSAKHLARSTYASMCGPTVGDRIRLGDTSLVIEIEWDACTSAGYGNELKFGGGKVLRDGMGQQAGVSETDALDLVISNVIILDVSGVYKADVGIKNGLIAGIGKAGNLDIMPIYPPNMIFAATTDSIDGSGMILTAGGVDSHVHFICPQLVEASLASGITTLIGGGQGPTSGTNATTCTTSSAAILTMLQATDSLPVNIGLTGKGNSSDPRGLREQIEAGVVGLKIHEDWGTTPKVIDTCLTLAEEMDVQVTIHTDTLNESSSCPDTIAAIGERTIHAYHCEGAGGGHAPDIIAVCGNRWVLPSSTNPTRPFTQNTVDEHVDMLMVCHHLDKNLPEDVSFAESRIRGETIAAEDVLHDMGAISIVSSDSQAMGRVTEVITRTWQTAHKMKMQRGHLEPEPQQSQRQQQQRNSDATPAPPIDVHLAAETQPELVTPAPAEPSSFSTSAATSNSPESPLPLRPFSLHPLASTGWTTPHDNFRARRYVAKYTINPSIAHGVSHLIGSVTVGKVADLVLWSPALFGARPEIVIKGGVIARAEMGDASASIPTPQPRMSRNMFGAMGSAASSCSIAFVSGASVIAGRVQKYGLKKRVEAVRRCRGITKQDMVLNNVCPNIHVDPTTFRVMVNGAHLTCAPATQLPLTKLIGLF